MIKPKRNWFGSENKLSKSKKLQYAVLKFKKAFKVVEGKLKVNFASKKLKCYKYTEFVQAWKIEKFVGEIHIYMRDLCKEQSRHFFSY